MLINVGSSVNDCCGRHGHFNENVTDFIDKEMSERTRGKGELRETGISSTSAFYQLIVKQLTGANNRKKLN